MSWTPPRSVAVKALCVCRRGGRILVQDLADPAGRRFFRPFGGAVEFGERAADAVRRELREELDAELADLVLLGVLESLFVYDGHPGHEVVFVFDGALADASLYGRDDLVGREAEGDPVPGVWVEVGALPAGVPLYPEGLAELLREGA
ncbi:MAG TPA: NUDIX domain-containing protein [Longimicrobium sp.]|nr:NUDIX domain-containing protein [Longimicrobium sp.]